MHYIMLRQLISVLLFAGYSLVTGELAVRSTTASSLRRDEARNNTPSMMRPMKEPRRSLATRRLISIARFTFSPFNYKWLDITDEAISSGLMDPRKG
jgi:hypothetical protein